MKLIRQKKVREKMGDISEATFYRTYRHDPKFPKPVIVAKGLNTYPEEEVDEYIEKLKEQRSRKGNTRGNSQIA